MQEASRPGAGGQVQEGQVLLLQSLGGKEQLLAEFPTIKEQV